MREHARAPNIRNIHNIFLILWLIIVSGSAWAVQSPRPSVTTPVPGGIAASAQSTPKPALLRDFATDRILVKPKETTPRTSMQSLHAQRKAKMLRRYAKMGDLQEIQLAAGSDIFKELDSYRKSGLVEYAEPDYVCSIAATHPNDPFYQNNQLWGLNNLGYGIADEDIDAPEAWEMMHDASNVIVAILDTGMEYTHPDLATNLWVNTPEDLNENGKFDNWPSTEERGGVYGDLDGLDNDQSGWIDDVVGYDFCTLGQRPIDNDPLDENGHGTRAAGVAGAQGNNGLGVVGVAWDVKLMPIKFMDGNGRGFVSDAIQSIDYARAMHANIINNSWVTRGSSQALFDVINAARIDGIIFVGAAGNFATNNDDFPLYPASYSLDNVVSVAATDSSKNLAYFSNWGAESVDIGAPGMAIASCFAGGYSTDDGTSLAAPFISGALALVKAAFPSESYLRTIRRLLYSVDPLTSLNGKCRTGGRLNLHSALTVTPPDLWITPNSSAAFGGFVGGTISPSGKTYSVSNSGASAITWTAAGNQSWLTVSPLSGSLSPGQSATVTVSVNGNAASLPVGVYAASVQFSNTINGSGNETRSVSLNIVNGQMHVKPDGNDLNNGLNWASAKETVQAAIDAAVPGQDVWIVQGTYLSDGGFVIRRDVRLYGGFAGVETTLGERDWLNNTTILQQLTSGSTISVLAGVTSAATIDGFTISGANINDIGGGILCWGSSPTITNNIIKSNASWNSGSGGGICLMSASPTIVNNVICDNFGFSEGGGILCVGGAPTVTGNTIVRNTGSALAGGIVCDGSSPTISNNFIGDNRSASTRAAGISCLDASPVIADNVIRGNTHQGIYCEASPAIVTNNTIIGNRGGVSCVFASPQLSNNLIAFNSFGISNGGSIVGTPVLRNNCLFNPGGNNYEGLSAAPTDVQADPILPHPEYGQLHLQSGSPCLDAGWNGAPSLPSTDMDGDPRILGGSSTVDIGADEYNGTVPSYAPVIVRVSPVGNDENDGSSWSLAKLTVQSAVDAATLAGGEVWVKAGSYGNTTLKPYAYVYGGFNGSEVSKAARNWNANPTVLSEGSPAVVAAEGIGALNATTGLSAIDGFTIQSGDCGIRCDYASPNIENNVIKQNTLAGGIYCLHSSPRIVNNIITANASPAGGGIYCEASSPEITGNKISRNGATNGAGIYCTSSSSVITRNVLSGNDASQNGGGIYCAGSSPTLGGNVVTANSAASGGGIYCSSATSSTLITNNTFLQNLAVSGGGVQLTQSSPRISNNIVSLGTSGICADALSSPVLRNNCVYNPDGQNYSGISAGTGDIIADPALAFVQYGQAHLQSGSPCINAGWNGASGIPSSDIDGAARVTSGTVDIGADEFSGSTPSYTPTIVRVKTQGNDQSDGSTWATAKRTVSAAIGTAAVQGGEVWVEAGKYDEAVALEPFVYLYGGFAGTESARTQRNWTSNVSEITGAGLPAITSTGIGHRTTCLDGFTVSSYADVNCMRSSLTIANNKLCGSDTAIECQGGGSSIIYNNVISGSSASGIDVWSSSAVITNNTLIGNRRGLFLGSSNSALANNIVAFSGGIGIEASGGTPILRNNCVYNPGHQNYSGISAGQGDISVDPQIAYAVYGQAHLNNGSPCINAGYNGAGSLPQTDMDGQDRIFPLAGTVDIGADEFVGAPPAYSVPIFRVRSAGNDQNDGSTWALAKLTVQAGIDAAARGGGEVWVETGTYSSIDLKTFVHVYGGFAGNEATRLARNWRAYPTVLQASYATIVEAAGIGAGLSTVDGFVIRNGEKGILCGSASPRIANNTIVGNTDGGLRCEDRSMPTIVNNVIVANNGGGIYCLDSSPAITNNTIAGNVADSAAGILCYGSSPQISNNIIAYNVSGIGNIGDISYPTGAPILRNNCFYNPYGDNYSGVSAGQGDILADPRLGYPQHGGVHLLSSSSCINAGWNQAPGLPDADLDGETRILPAGGTVDIGADEYSSSIPPFVPPVVRVSLQGNDANDGSTWPLAKRTIQAGIDALSQGGEVWVAAGTYEPVTLEPFVYVYGGFAGNESSRSQRNRIANETIIDGSSGNAVTSTAPGYGAASVDGFTLSGGFAGVNCYASSPLIQYNKITATYGLAGVYSVYSSPFVLNNTITANGSGAIRCESSATRIVGNTISNNQGDAGAIFVSYGATTVIDGNWIEGNTSNYSGGGLFIDSVSDVRICNNVFTGNSCVSSGGALAADGGANMSIVSNTFVGNTAGICGGAIYLSQGAATIANDIFNDNGSTYAQGKSVFAADSCSVSYCDAFNVEVQNDSTLHYYGTTNGSGLLFQPPAFMSGPGKNYHLAPQSPCINAGWNSAPKMPLTDRDGQARIQFGAVDIGMDEADTGPAAVTSISGAKSANNNSYFSASGLAVTAAFDGFFYVETQNRQAGIRIDKIGHALAVGMKADIVGVVRENQDGERYIDASDAHQNGSGEVKPSAMSAKTMGGGAFGLQQGVAGGTGLNNIGILMSLTGRIYEVHPGWLKLYDGSNVEFRVLVPTGVANPPLGSYTRVTGISSCEKVDGNMLRLLRMRTIQGLGDFEVIVLP